MNRKRGNDADLIMLAIVSHEPHMILLTPKPCTLNSGHPTLSPELQVRNPSSSFTTLDLYQGGAIQYLLRRIGRSGTESTCISQLQGGCPIGLLQVPSLGTSPCFMYFYAPHMYYTPWFWCQPPSIVDTLEAETLQGYLAHKNPPPPVGLYSSPMSRDLW